jgi:tetratricopeptide (TPR) repeat protein
MRKRRSLWSYNEMGLFFYSREAYDLAIAEFKRALAMELFPIAALHVNLGAAYLGKKMHAEARVCLLQALKIEPDNQKGHWLLAQTLKATGQRSDALAEFERAYAIAPETPTAANAREEIRALRSAPSEGGAMDQQPGAAR